MLADSTTMDGVITSLAFTPARRMQLLMILLSDSRKMPSVVPTSTMADTSSRLTEACCPFGLISAILTLLILVLSEIIPKTIGASYWRSLAMPSTKIIRVLIFITYPLVLLSELITKVFTPKNHQASVSREEVSAMVDVGTTEGIFRESESKIIKSCIRLASVKAREVMTPSIVVESANVNLTIKEFYEQQTWNFSRIPVYDNSKDYIIGYVLKDMVLKELSEDKFDTRLSDLMRPILSFNEDDSVYQIWEKMLEKREHISIILDEYGCLRGVVSMEDIIETMTGVEIVDEDDVAVDMQAFAKEKSRRRFNASTCFGTHSGI